MRRFVIQISVLIAFVAWAAIASAWPPDKPKDKPKEKEPPPAVLPEDAIIAIFEIPDALDKWPQRLLVTEEWMKAHLAEIERLKRLSARTKASRPSTCALEGKIAGNVLTFTARYEFETVKADEAVRLGCGQAHAAGVSLGAGRTPRLRPPSGEKGDAEGFVVEIGTPGEQALTLDLMMAIASQSGSQGLTLDLPGAAITTIALELPGGVRDVRLGGKPIADTLLKLSGNKLVGGLRPGIEKLELTWQPAQAGGIATVLLAKGEVTARLDGKELTTDARLTLSVQSGQVKEWRLLVPPKAELKFGPEAQSRIARVEVGEQNLSSLRTIHLKAATSDPLVFDVKHTQPAPAPATGKSASVGPFVVLGAVRHSGSLLVCNAEPTWHPEFTPHGDLTRRAVTGDEQGREANCVAAFRYGPGDGPGPWLDVAVERVRGQIKTKASHKLRLEADAGGARWHVLTTLEIVPRWADLDQVTVQLPPDCTLGEAGQLPLPERVQSISEDPATRLVTIRLSRGAGGERSLAPILVELAGVYSDKVDLERPGKAALGLPAPVGTARGGGTVTVTSPAGVELVAPDETPPWAGLEVSSQTVHEVVLRYTRRPPASLPLSWRPHRPEVVVVNRADVTLTAGEVRVRQELHYSWPAGPVPRLALRVPPEIAAVAPTVEGGRLVGLEGVPGERGVRGFLPDPTARRGQTLLVVFEYAYPLPPARPGAMTLPLVSPAGITRGESRVRLWSDPGHLPSRAGEWVEQNIEVVAGRSRLPVLVLRSSKVDLPLQVVLGERSGPFALVDRALVRVEVKSGLTQAYRVSYRLARLEGGTLDFELPAPAGPIRFKATLDGKLIAYDSLASDDAEMNNRIVRLRLPPSKPGGFALLELGYHLDADRLRGSPLTTTLAAPKLLGESGHIPTRWAVVTPPSYVVLGPEMGPTPRPWSRRGWLLAPRVGIPAAELERWLLDAEPPSGASAVSPTLVLWHDSASPVRLIHMPQLWWLLACSLGLVLVGLLLARLVLNEEGGPSSLRIGLVLSGLAAALVAAGLFVPDLMGQLAYGCQPGVLILVVLVVIQRLLHERYRRQIVFLPSFTRASRKGSSLHRAEPRPHGQPSTVDAPHPLGSSIDRLA